MNDQDIVIPSDEESLPQQEPTITLKEFGNKLREERTRFGHTTDEIASHLKITSRMVRAIEDGDMSSMPHAVYAKGFIRSYAKLLGLRDEDALQACKELNKEEDEIPHEHFTSSDDIPNSEDNRHGSCLICIFFLICLIVGGSYWVYTNDLHQVVWEYINSLKSHDSSTEPKQDSSDKIPPATEPFSRSESMPASVNLPAVLVTEVTPPKMPEAASELPVLSESKPSAQIAITETMPQQETNLTLQTGDGTGTLISPADTEKKHQIIMTALAECWVHTSADNTDTRQLSIQKGETFALSFNRRLVIKLGNAGGVRIKYDGKELSVPGKVGQVKTLIFPEAGATLASSGN